MHVLNVHGVSSCLFLSCPCVHCVPVSLFHKVGLHGTVQIIVGCLDNANNVGLLFINMKCNNVYFNKDSFDVSRECTLTNKIKILRGRGVGGMLYN